MIFDSDKILFYPEKISEWMNNENPFPITIELDLTNKCNNMCDGCCGGFDTNDSLDKDQIEQIIHDLSECGIKGITFTGGGEPLMHKDIIYAISLCKKLNIKAGLITNGGLLDRHDNSKILNYCEWVRISVDAGDADTYKLTHGMNSSEFFNVCCNIKNLVNMKNQIGSKCIIGVGYLTGIKTNTYDQMNNFIKLFDDIGTDYVQFRPYLSYGKNDLHEFKKINFSVFESKNTKILYSKHKYDCIHNDDVDRKYDKCYGSQFVTTICANGDVTLCCHSRGNSIFTFGNIKDNSFKDIWNSEKRKSIIDNLSLEWCPDLCRCDSFNRILFSLKQDKLHKEFL